MASPAEESRRSSARLMRSGLHAALRGACFQNGEELGQMEKLKGNLRAFQAFAGDHGQTDAAAAQGVQQSGRPGEGSGRQFRMQLTVIAGGTVPCLFRAVPAFREAVFG